MSNELFTEMITTGYHTPPGLSCIEGLPEGAHFVGAYPSFRCIELVYEHDSWEEIEIPLVVGPEDYPTLEIVWQKKYDEKIQKDTNRS